MSTNDKKIEVFQDLLEITNDRLKGYEKVKEKVLNDNPALKELFANLKEQTQEMQIDLVKHLGELGGEADNDGTVLGAIHRGWIEVKDAFVSDKAESTLENAIFGEKAAIKAYEKAAKEDGLCDKCHSIINDHLSKLRDSLQKAEALEEIVD